MWLRKVKNISEVQVDVRLKSGNSVGLPPGKAVENIEVENINDVKPLVEVTYDLTEVQPVVEGKKKLND